MGKPQSAAPPLALDKSGTWRGLQGGALYGLVVTEDEQAEAAARAAEPRRASYVPVALPAAGSKAKPLPWRSDDGSTRASELLTEELAALDVDDVRGRTARYAALREARDLQDVVFGAG